MLEPAMPAARIQERQACSFLLSSRNFPKSAIVASHKVTNLIITSASSFCSHDVNKMTACSMDQGNVKDIILGVEEDGNSNERP